MSNPNIIWQNTLDGKYECYVLRQTDAYGILRMTDTETSEVVLDREVPTSKYFKDRDILEWGEICMNVAGRL